MTLDGDLLTQLGLLALIIMGVVIKCRRVRRKRRAQAPAVPPVVPESVVRLESRRRIPK